jgi:glutamine cyclotransferase
MVHYLQIALMNARKIAGPNALPATFVSAFSFKAPLAITWLLLFQSCGKAPHELAGQTNAPAAETVPTTDYRAVQTNIAPATLAEYSYEIVNTWPHDRKAFTQGLVFHEGSLLESTGLNGQSTLRRVNLETGEVLKQINVPSQYFAEGLAVLGRKAFQLTWQNGKGFVYDVDDFSKQGEFAYAGEGWGLTTDGESLILSDGSERIRFLDPATFKVTRTISVTARGAPINRLNELEYVKGEIFANIWQTDFVVRVDPKSGAVVGFVNFSGLLGPADYALNIDVFNGIAYDAAGDRLFVTGKNWPKLFEVRLKPKSP